MFSRNEKYGQALHLKYGYENTAASKQKKGKTTFINKLVSFFSPASDAQAIADINPQLELDLDQAFINKAITSELKNHDSAANQNRLHDTDEKIA